MLNFYTGYGTKITTHYHPYALFLSKGVGGDLAATPCT